MGERVARLVVDLLLLVLAGLFLVSLGYFAIGSLESFPTPEQEQKVRTVTGAGMVLFAAAGAGLLLIRRALRA
jgi:hypothetical protein